MPVLLAGLTALGVHGDSHVVITGGQDGSAHLSNIETGRALGELTGVCAASALVWVVSHGRHHTCCLHSAGHTESVEAAAFSPIQPLSATASIDGQLLLWDNATLSQRVSCSHPEVGDCSAVEGICSYFSNMLAAYLTPHLCPRRRRSG